MRILLDTHTFIWLDTDPTRLSAAAIAVLADPSNTLLLSSASVWEMAIKVGTGKLLLSADLQTVLTDQTTRNPITILAVAAEHALQVQGLPPIHKDPFDRMLVAPAQVEGATILTCDANIPRYPVPTIW